MNASTKQNEGLGKYMPLAFAAGIVCEIGAVATPSAVSAELPSASGGTSQAVRPDKTILQAK